MPEYFITLKGKLINRAYSPVPLPHAFQSLWTCVLRIFPYRLGQMTGRLWVCLVQVSQHFRVIHVIATIRASLPFHCLNVSNFVYCFIVRFLFGLFSPLGYRGHCCYEYLYTSLSVKMSSHFSGVHTQVWSSLQVRGQLCAELFESAKQPGSFPTQCYYFISWPTMCKGSDFSPVWLTLIIFCV